MLCAVALEGLRSDQGNFIRFVLLGCEWSDVTINKANAYVKYKIGLLKWINTEERHTKKESVHIKDRVFFFRSNLHVQHRLAAEFVSTSSNIHSTAQQLNRKSIDRLGSAPIKSKTKKSTIGILLSAT